MLIHLPTIGEMTPWEVIEEALARRKPPKNQEWLADQLTQRSGKRVTPQGISNWKSRGVPAARHAELADLFGLTTDQVAGRAPLPWEKDAGWPFPDIEQARYDRLRDMQKGEIQREVRKLIEAFERESVSGKSTPSPRSAAR